MNGYKAYWSTQRPFIEKRYRNLCQKMKLKLIEPYTHTQEKLKHQCLKCNFIWKIKPNDVKNRRKDLSKGNRCPECKKIYLHNKYAKPFTYFKRKIEKHKKVKVLGRTNNNKIKAECLKCKFVWYAGRGDLTMGSGCPICKEREAIKHSTKRKLFILGKRKVFVQGNEPFALKILIECGINPRDIRVAQDVETPIIRLNGGRKHYPDIFLPKRNLLVEVKSTWTMFCNDWFHLNQEKARAALEQGFDYRMWIFGKHGERMTLPKDWMFLSKLEVKKRCKSLPG